MMVTSASSTALLVDRPYRSAAPRGSAPARKVMPENQAPRLVAENPGTLEMLLPGAASTRSAPALPRRPGGARECLGNDFQVVAEWNGLLGPRRSSGDRLLAAPRGTQAPDLAYLA